MKLQGMQEILEDNNLCPDTFGSTSKWRFLTVCIYYFRTLERTISPFSPLSIGYTILQLKIKYSININYKHTGLSTPTRSMVTFYVTKLIPKRNATESYKLHWYVEIQQVHQTPLTTADFLLLRYCLMPLEHVNLHPRTCDCTGGLNIGHSTARSLNCSSGCGTVNTS